MDAVETANQLLQQQKVTPAQLETMLRSQEVYENIGLWKKREKVFSKVSDRHNIPRDQLEKVFSEVCDLFDMSGDQVHTFPPIAHEKPAEDDSSPQVLDDPNIQRRINALALTVDEVMEIRQIGGHPDDLAAKYGVSASTIRNAISRCNGYQLIPWQPGDKDYWEGKGERGKHLR